MLTGGCLCGAVRFEIDGELGPITCCHCSRCRRASGSAFTAAASVDATCFRIVSGERLLREYESSPQNWRVFCLRCGSEVFGRHDEYPVIRVRVGGLDDDPGHRVAAHMMMDSKAPWFEIGDVAEQFTELAPISYFLPDATMTRRSAPTSGRANAALVQRAYDALRRRDMAAAFALLAPDVEISQAREIPWGGDYRGHENAAKFFARLVETITSTVTIERFIDAGDTIVAIGRTKGTVNATGHAFDVPIAHAWTIADGLVVRIQFFIDDPTMLSAL